MRTILCPINKYGWFWLVACAESISIELLCKNWSKSKKNLNGCRGRERGKTFTSLAAKQVCLGPVKRATWTEFAAKSTTSLYFLQHLNFSQPPTTWFVAKQVPTLVVKSAAYIFNSSVSIILQIKLSHAIIVKYSHKSGTHNLEEATSMYSCHGVFTDQFIFRTILARI